MMASLLQDLRYGLRALRQNPGITAVAVVSLALAIGANTTVFTWMDRFVLQPLPGVAGAAQMVHVNTRAPGGDEWSVSIPVFKDWRAGCTTMELAARTFTQLGLKNGEQTDRVFASGVSDNFFQVLRVRPFLGRYFQAGEDDAQAPLVVLGYSFWVRHFRADSSIIGRTLVLNGHGLTVIGVAPPRFGGADVGLNFDLYYPMQIRHVLTGSLDPRARRGWQFLDVVGRLRPGVTFVQAQTELQAVAVRASVAAGSDADRGGAVLSRYSDREAGQFLKPVFTALLGITGVILLIACANVANLLLARAAARRREIAVRLAMGATRGRLVRQLLTESLVLGLVAGIAGLLIAFWGRDLLAGFVPPAAAPINIDFQVNAAVLGFALGVSLVTAALFGLMPALQASSPALVPALKDEIGSGPAHHGRLQSALVVTQVALSLVSLVCAGLFARSLQQARRVDVGFTTPEQVLLIDSDLSPGGFFAADSLAIPMLNRLLENVRAVPGVAAASIGDQVPLGFGGGGSSSAVVEGYTPRPDENMSIDLQTVGDDYFRAMGIPIVAGRPIEARDLAPGAPRVIVVNQAFARRFWPGLDPIGRRVNQGRDWSTVIGVARDGKYRQLNEVPHAFTFFPYTQDRPRSFTVHVRATGDPKALTAPLRRAFAAASGDLPFLDVRTMAEHMQAAMFAQKLGAYMLAGFGALALLLSSIGIYGVMAYAVSRRTREIGVRVALGAARRDVIGMVVGRAMRIAGLGLLIGAGAALGAGQLLRSQLLGISPRDPAVYAVIALLLGTVAFVASWLPARRAAAVDPLVALRYE
jgi:putative ABC transport system permease protein